MTVISAPPFSATELHRERVYTASRCQHCGERSENPFGQPFLYEYSLVSPASGGKIANLGLFCGMDCFDSYRG